MFVMDCGNIVKSIFLLKTINLSNEWNGKKNVQIKYAYKLNKLSDLQVCSGLQKQRGNKNISILIVLLHFLTREVNR